MFVRHIVRCWDALSPNLSPPPSLDYGCANDPSTNCIAYAGCETLVSTPVSYVDREKENANNNNSPSAAAVTPKESVGDEVDEFITALEAACSEKSLQTLEGIGQCHNKCQTHLCCFTSDTVLAGNDCSSTHVEACSAYKPCERLVAPGAKNPMTAGSAAAAGGGEVDLDKVADAVEKACSLPQDPYLVDSAWVAACHSACASRFCCLLDSKIGSSCLGTVGSKECSAYGACEVLINGSTGKEIVNPSGIEEKVGDINYVCNPAVDTDPKLYDACEERCKTRGCCFEEKPEYSCYHMVRRRVAGKTHFPSTLLCA